MPPSACKKGRDAEFAQRIEMIHGARFHRSEEHTSELQSLAYLVCRLLLEKKKNSDYTSLGNTRNDPHLPTINSSYVRLTFAFVCLHIFTSPNVPYIMITLSAASSSTMLFH